ncbi:MAG: hypothetical protein JO110_21615 [Acetobacteraceae bacterium]|nr:hypothetical protein [Acetobacteraceae bacterium]
MLRRTILKSAAAVASGTILGMRAVRAQAPFLTNVAPGAAAYGNNVLVVATASDGRIFYNWWQLGGGSHDWLEIDGNGRTDATPAASFTVLGDNVNEVDMWRTIKGTDDNIYINNGGKIGTGFSEWVLFQGLQTTVAPAATIVNNGTWPIGAYTPVVVAADAHGLVYYDMGLDPNGWRELAGGGRTDAALAAALAGDSYLFVVAKGLDGQLYLNQGELGGSFTGWEGLGFSTNLAPAASSAGNTTVLVATGTDGRVYYDWWALGEGGHGLRPLDGDGRTDAAPAAALMGNNYLFILAKGLDGHIYLNQGELGGSFTGWSML